MRLRYIIDMLFYVPFATFLLGHFFGFRHPFGWFFFCFVKNITVIKGTFVEGTQNNMPKYCQFFFFFWWMGFHHINFKKDISFILLPEDYFNNSLSLWEAETLILLIKFINVYVGVNTLTYLSQMPKKEKLWKIRVGLSQMFVTLVNY